MTAMCACGHTASSHFSEGCYACTGPQPCNVPEVAQEFYDWELRP